jgi:hypothetical protein
MIQVDHGQLPREPSLTSADPSQAIKTLVQATSLSMVHNRHQGETAILACNGPSLNHVDFRLIREYPVIGLNKIFLGIKRFGIVPRYYVAINRLVIEQSYPQIAALPCIKFLPVELLGGAQLPPPPLCFLLKTENPAEHFYQDISAGVNQGSTVTYVALQIAFFMGFSKVIIVGMDHKYNFSGKPHEKTHFMGDDLNHFDPSYFRDQQWNNPDLATSEESYRVARWKFECAGRRIIDCTIGGACDVFEKESLEQALLKP